MPDATEKVVYYEKRRPTVGRFFVEIEMVNNIDLNLSGAGALPVEKVRRVKLRGLVDSGAARLVVPERVARELGLMEASREVVVSYASGERARRRMVSNVYAKVQGRDGVFDAIVEPNRDEALIGALPLEVFDFLIDCHNQKLVPRDPDHIVAELDGFDDE
ncbi:MAG: aspartyl protease family protein [Phycisphaeraceae bacterium]